MPKQIRNKPTSITIKFPYFKNITKITIKVKYPQSTNEDTMLYESSEVENQPEEKTGDFVFMDNKCVEDKKLRDIVWHDKNRDRYRIPYCYQSSDNLDEINELSSDILKIDDVIVEDPKFGTCCICCGPCNVCSEACDTCVSNGYYSYGICERCGGMCHPIASLCSSCMLDLVIL